jgi:putative transposase
VKNAEDWQWSSYNSLTSDKKTKLKKDEVIDLYGSCDNFKNFHKSKLDLHSIDDILIDL